MPAYTQTRYPLRYEEPVSKLIQWLKFGRKLHMARILGELMADCFARIDSRPDLLIPVPLHAERLAERGYNQALEIARPIAKHLGIPLDFKSCVRTRGTAAQSDLPAVQRSKNVKGAFALRNALNADRVVIVDDVMTTGATANELARTLLESDVGVKEVHVWVCARAVLRD